MTDSERLEKLAQNLVKVGDGMYHFPSELLEGATLEDLRKYLDSL